jgi:hypothetical protein
MSEKAVWSGEDTVCFWRLERNEQHWNTEINSKTNVLVKTWGKKIITKQKVR